jgi:hypothetical protein
LATGTSVSNTAFGIINDAMVDAGLLQSGQRPDSEQVANYLRRLNDIVNLWQTYGLKLWLQQEVTLPLVAGVGLYQLGPTASPGVVMPKPSRVLQAYVLIATSNVRRPLVIISVDEWERLGQVIGNQGPINSIMIRKDATYLEVNCFLIPDTTEAANTCILLCQVQSTNPILVSDTTSFPQEWRIALRWALAEDICTGQPQAIVDRCAKNAQLYRQQLEGWDVEDAPTYFAVDTRMYQGSGRFR